MDMEIQEQWDHEEPQLIVVVELVDPQEILMELEMGLLEQQ
jgi:hypothetical protein